MFWLHVVYNTCGARMASLVRFARFSGAVGGGSSLRGFSSRLGSRVQSSTCGLKGIDDVRPHDNLRTHKGDNDTHPGNCKCVNCDAETKFGAARN